MTEPGISSGSSAAGIDGQAAHSPAWWARVLIALGFLALLAVDPLNAGSGASQRSEQSILRIVSPFYSASNAVTVVLIDDAYLGRVRSGWPLSYREQGLLLRRILAHEPAAVFVDLLYRHRHSRPSATADTASNASGADDPLDLLRPLPGATNQRVPLLFAVLGRDDSKVDACTETRTVQPPSRADLLDVESIDRSLRAPFGLEPQATVAEAPAVGPRVGTALGSWSGCGGSDPLLLAGSDTAATPAMALYDATCRRRADLAGCRLGGMAPLDVPHRFQSPLTVRWGAFAPSSQDSFYAAGTCQRSVGRDAPVSFWAKLGRSLQQLALGALFDMRSQDDPEIALPCPAVPVIRADAILDGDPAKVEALLRGRAVMLGASVSGIPDWQPSGVHGLVPGVVWHAMALDNLLVSGDRYLKPLTKRTSRTIMVALAFAAALLAPWVVRRKPWFSEPVRVWAGLGLWLAYATVLLSHGHRLQALAVVAVALAFDLIKPSETFRLAALFMAMSGLAMLAVALGRSPWNWIGLAFVVLATVETLKGYLKGSAPKPFPHPASRMRWAWTTWHPRSAAPPAATGGFGSGGGAP